MIKRFHLQFCKSESFGLKSSALDVPLLLQTVASMPDLRFLDDFYCFLRIDPT